jgi:Flp pilus assembly protein TadG
MSAREHSPLRNQRRNRQRGTAAVELALVIFPFLLFIFGIMEMARSMFVVNTLQEVTRRAAAAAANSDFHETALNIVRQRAVLRNSAGPLVLSDPVTDQHVRIEYMALIRNPDGSTTPTLIPTSSMPDSVEKNLATCAADSNAPTCIRFVRARICDPSNTDACAPVIYKPIFPLIPFPMSLPASTTIVPAQSLGYVPPVCLPCGT